MNDENDTAIKVTKCEPTAEIKISGGGDVSPVSHRLPPELQFYGNESKVSCDPIFDHENLLRKYIKWVRKCSAYTYISDTMVSMDVLISQMHFSDQEWAELKRLAES